MNESQPLPPSQGVVATLTVISGGRMRLTLDDVRTLPVLDATAWKHERLFTYNDYDGPALEAVNLSREQFAEIGENLIIRLLALRNSDLEE